MNYLILLTILLTALPVRAECVSRDMGEESDTSWVFAPTQCLLTLHADKRFGCKMHGGGVSCWQNDESHTVKLFHKFVDGRIEYSIKVGEAKEVGFAWQLTDTVLAFAAEDNVNRTCTFRRNIITVCTEVGK